MIHHIQLACPAGSEDTLEARFPPQIPTHNELQQFHVDLETGRDLYIDPAAARANYRKNFASHAAEVERACSDLGVSFYQLSTAQPLEPRVR